MNDEPDQFDEDSECCPCQSAEDEFFQHITDKYFPFGLDDESVDGESFSPTPGAW